jgi:hypothetical protein
VQGPQDRALRVRKLNVERDIVPTQVEVTAGSRHRRFG